MKVILLQSVARIGQRDTIAEVADGYALNFLIPQGKAQQATPEKVAKLEKHLASERERLAANEMQLAQALQTLEGRRFVIKVRANDKGHLFKGLGAEEIAREIRAQSGAPFELSMIEGLQSPIKTIGEHRLSLAAAGKRALITLAVEEN